MNKSDKLDELRLEVGMIADRVSTCNDFYIGIINTMGNLLPHQFGVAIYNCSNGYFSHFIGYGNLSEPKVVKYGDGMFSICSIRGEVTIHKSQGKTLAYAPFYDGHHLKGILLAECQDARYDVTEEDIIFLEEISKFIGEKGRHYLSF
ncbi:hypothetical protein DS745_17620 [Anaerobacillus alkaliphilus]|uniref:GAF domain-containing protein n=1 Tax=Anaerobacillus alkaliphilus TaxID=1548597 RepID=A0A4Q0VRX7_9BACI|nr:hypothetical protein [Anaerobacillus alkaliphilus]RXI98160.1 hypothetical protein DS745_17620 [Anaerobacillus alkaliphilus]